MAPIIVCDDSEAALCFQAFVYRWDNNKQA